MPAKLVSDFEPLENRCRARIVVPRASVRIAVIAVVADIIKLMRLNYGGGVRCESD